MKFTVFCFALMMAACTALAQKANDALLLDMYQNQRYMEAANYLKSVYPEPVSDMKVLSRLAYTYQMAGKLPDAIGYYQRMYLQDSTNVPVLFNLASLNATRDNNAQALFYYQKIIAVDSLNFSVNKRLGNMYSLKLDTVNALKYLTRANKIDADEPEVAVQLSAFLLLGNKNKEADAVLRKSLAADTTNIILIRALMKLSYATKKYPQTIKYANTLLALGDDNADIYNKMASAYYELKNYACCIEWFMELPSIYQTERTFYLTAESYKKLKDYNKALEYFNQVLLQSISDNTYAYYSEIADTYQTMHKLKPATVNYQKSLFFKEKPMVFYSLANLYDTDLHNKRDAIKYYKKYLETNPPAKDKDYITYVQSRIKILQAK
ncbi:Flp pilus assembly protein TadD [Mucilaginibacter gracilis]|uniref:Flp pilus assembly protein TadD n=1 Tax=Mucilaginibacter gracilis TaxID=423350 RepID=A0A495J7S9_9SPHI|nr:hypothetical protein [Mucilaginibacter gracilis]RKR84937.1 Flp pilus assembly protein TadD [Mucilaginibacter gracilis]